MNKIIITILGIMLIGSSFALESENKIWYGSNESNTSQMIPILLNNEGKLKMDLNLVNITAGIIAAEYYCDLFGTCGTVSQFLAGGGSGIWTNVSSIATYYGDINVTGMSTFEGDNISLSYNISTLEMQLKDESKILLNISMDYTNGTLENVTTHFDIKQDFTDMIYDVNGTLTNILSYKNEILVDNSSLLYSDGNVIAVVPNG